MDSIITAVLIMTGHGVVFAAILATADHFQRVAEDERLEKIEELLPGNNCGACGEPGCRAFAEKLVRGEILPAQCTVSTADTLSRIAAILDVEVGAQEKRVARLKCAGGVGLVGELAAYRGIPSCRAATLIDGGGRA